MLIAGAKLEQERRADGKTDGGGKDRHAPVDPSLGESQRPDVRARAGNERASNRLQKYPNSSPSAAPPPREIVNPSASVAAPAASGRCAQRLPHRHLAAPHRRPREQQVRDVDARDQQHDTRDSQEQRRHHPGEFTHGGHRSAGRDVRRESAARSVCSRGNSRRICASIVRSPFSTGAQRPSRRQPSHQSHARPLVLSGIGERLLYVGLRQQRHPDLRRVRRRYSNEPGGRDADDAKPAQFDAGGAAR